LYQNGSKYDLTNVFFNYYTRIPCEFHTKSVFSPEIRVNVFTREFLERITYYLVIVEKNQDFLLAVFPWTGQYDLFQPYFQLIFKLHCERAHVSKGGSGHFFQNLQWPYIFYMYVYA
jgi:hypothetical protein